MAGKSLLPPTLFNPAPDFLEKVGLPPPPNAAEASNVFFALGALLTGSLAVMASG
jgi:hypothetical protein